MSPFAINLVLALAWAALMGAWSLGGLAVGFLVGYAVLWMLRPLLHDDVYSRRLGSAVSLALYFLFELVVSSVRVAWYVLAPWKTSRPGIVAVPLEPASDNAVAVLANLVSLTPGSLSVDVSEDRRTLLVHAMFVDDPEEERRTIKRGMERRVLEAFR